MRAVIQRVTRASVRLPSGEVRAIGPGLLIYLGIGPADDEASAAKLASKIANLRIFAESGKFDRSLLDVKGAALVISQFTLFANAKGGRRPDFTAAAKPELAKPLCNRFAELLSGLGIAVSTGEFGAHMKIDSLNDGPVTIWLDTASL